MERSRSAARLWCAALVVLLLVAAAGLAIQGGAGQNGTPGPAGPTGSVSLLSHLPYPPGERDQGAVATCWVWAGTAVLEIAHSVQDGVRDPLSVQFVDSTFNGGAGPTWAGSVGSVSDFAAFYRATGMAVPRSNRNADYQDGAHAVWCRASKRAWVPASSIETTPHYPITSISAREVATDGTRAETIARIKALLDRGTAVHLHLSWRNVLELGAFQLFWSTGGDEAVYDPVMWEGEPIANGLYHQMCVVGYDDTDPESPYWLVLNSWGTASGRRPNGTFRLNMDIDYTSRAATWTTLDVAFGPLSTATPGSGPEPVLAGAPGDAGVPTDPDGDRNGRPGRAGPELFFGRVPWIAASLLDCDASGRTGSADAVGLFDTPDSRFEPADPRGVRSVSGSRAADGTPRRTKHPSGRTPIMARVTIP